MTLEWNGVMDTKFPPNEPTCRYSKDAIPVAAKALGCLAEDLTVALEGTTKASRTVSDKHALVVMAELYHAVVVAEREAALCAITDAGLPRAATHIALKDRLLIAESARLAAFTAIVSQELMRLGSNQPARGMPLRPNKKKGQQG